MAWILPTDYFRLLKCCCIAEIIFLLLLSLLCCDSQLPLLSFSMDLAWELWEDCVGSEVSPNVSVMRWSPETYKVMKLNGFKSALSK